MAGYMLVVCRSALSSVWESEAEEHMEPWFGLDEGTYPYLRSLAGQPIYERGNGEQMKRHIKESKIIVTSYELLGRSYNNNNSLDFDVLHNILSDTSNYGMNCFMVLDESHAIGNPDAKCSKAVRELSRLPNVVGRMALTGTMAPDKPDSVWAQFDFIDHGKTFGNSYESFLDCYTKSKTIRIGSGAKIRKTIGVRRPDQLRRLIAGSSLRRTYLPGLPPMRINPTVIYAQGKQRNDCLKILDKMRKVLKDSHNTKPFSLARFIRSNGTFSTLFTELAATTAIAKTAYAKYQYLIARLGEQGGQAVIWVKHRDVGKDLAYVLSKKYKNDSVLVMGGETKENREKLLNQFKGGEKRFLIAGMDALREGNTFTNSAYAFYYELDWYLLNWSQSLKRLHRIGQKHNVLIDVPLLDTSLDAYMYYEVIKRKQHTVDQIEGEEDAKDYEPKSLMDYLNEVL